MDKQEIQQLVKTGEKKLLDAGIECAAAEIEIILEHLSQT